MWTCLEQHGNCCTFIQRNKTKTFCVSKAAQEWTSVKQWCTLCCWTSPTHTLDVMGKVWTSWPKFRSRLPTYLLSNGTCYRNKLNPLGPAALLPIPSQSSISVTQVRFPLHPSTTGAQHRASLATGISPHELFRQSGGLFLCQPLPVVASRWTVPSLVCPHPYT